MTSYYKHRMATCGIDISSLSVEEMQSIIRGLLEDRIHGISFSPYVAGQGPGTNLEDAQIRDRLGPVRPHVNWVRSFSCTEGNELIPVIARENGLKTMVGIWLGDDPAKNAEEMSAGIEIAKAGYADILGVGNEVLLRGDLGEDQLIDYINQARAACPGVEVGYVDAYYKFVDHPRVADACDVILANCYPFWEGCPADYALPYMKEMYRQAVSAARGKKVIVSETGWPNMGTAFEGAEPSHANAMRYFISTYKWAEEEGIDVFYFSSFDEDWKIDKEGDVGAYWGLWDKEGRPKYV